MLSLPDKKEQLKVTKSNDYIPLYSTVYGKNHDFPNLDGSSGTQAWSAQHNKADEWMILKLTNPLLIYGIVLQGRGNCGQWVKSLEIQTSRNGIDFQSEGKYLGCSDQNTHEILYFKKPLYCRMIKLTNFEWHSHISLRTGLLIGTE